MIVIFSTHGDYSTPKVVRWLYYYKREVTIINELNPNTDIYLEIEETESRRLHLTVNGKQKITYDQIELVWYKRGLHFFMFPYFRLRKEGGHKQFCLRAERNRSAKPVAPIYISKGMTIVPM
jgi:hypothetical protein